MKDAVIIEAVRTPFAKYNGAFRDIPANKLLANALESVVSRSGIDKQKIEDPKFQVEKGTNQTYQVGKRNFK
ncbi:MAG: hypothetical protein ACPHPA_04910, partial [Cycloclasticus pugetii]